MHRTSALGLTAALLLAWAGAATAQSAGRLGQVGWLAGCWERSTGPRIVEEQWMRPRAGLMLGASRTVHGDSLVDFEQVRLLERDGHLIYAAEPAGQPPAEFESTAVSDTAVVFENLAHDFPQRIIYRRRGADSLVARIEGTRGGQLRGRDFPYRKAACP
jgi:hypothetical protein